MHNQYHNNIDALVWLDTSAEQHALYRQAFTLARMRIEEMARGSGLSLRPRYCVFTDCDETILDNSEYNSWLVLTGRNFHNSSWDDYCRSKRSRACPGAVPFALWLAENGISLFYVTSRSNATRQETLENLAMLGFPVTEADASEDPQETNLFMAGMPNPENPGAPWTKWDQYEWVTRQRKIEPLLWLGDNLSDFRECYKSERWDQRLHIAEREDYESWGRRYIVMPNPVYGDWMRKYLSRRNSEAFLDDDASSLDTPLPVRLPTTPSRTPKMMELEIWPRFA